MNKSMKFILHLCSVELFGSFEKYCISYFSCWWRVCVGVFVLVFSVRVLVSVFVLVCLCVCVCVCVFVYVCLC